MKLSVVIPAYNESSIIEATLRTTSQRLAQMEPDYELILVDDGSTDDTAAKVRGLNDPHIRLEGYQPNHGKGRAVRVGMLAARGDFVVCTDADLAYGLENIPHMVKTLEETGCDLVIGSRRLSKDGYQSYPPSGSWPPSASASW